jgi:hypothetical protein
MAWKSRDVAYVLDTVGSSSPGDYASATASYIGLTAGAPARLWSVPSLHNFANATLTGAPSLCETQECRQLAAQAIQQFNALGGQLLPTHPLGSRVLSLPLDIRGSAAAGNASVIVFPSRFTGGAIIVNNTFSDSYGRCGLYNAPHSVVLGNDCRRAGPMFVGIGGLSWLEGPLLVSNVTVANNYFESIAGASTATDAVVVTGKGHTSDIRVANNTLGSRELKFINEIP